MTDSLTQRSKDDLIALIRQMVAIHPDLERLITAPGQPPAPVDVSSYRREIARARDDRYDDYYGRHTPVQAVENVALDAALEGHGFRRAGDFASALAVYEVVLQEIFEVPYHEYNHYREDPSIYDPISEAASGLVSLLRQLSFADQDAYRKRALFGLLNVFLYDIDAGGVDISAEPDATAAILQHARPEDIDKLRKAVQHAQASAGGSWGKGALSHFLVELETVNEPDLTKAVERLLREGLYTVAVGKLIAADHIDEALAVVEGASLPNHELFAVIEMLAGQGYQAQAISLAEEALRGTPDTFQITPWLLDQYQKTNQTEKRLDLLLRLTCMNFSQARYNALKQAATSLERWGEVRAEVLATLSPRGRLQLHIHEEDWEHAWEAFDEVSDTQRRFYVDSTPVDIKLAQDAGHVRPEQAIAILEKRARASIQNFNRSAYEGAASLLVFVKELYERRDQIEEWQSLIQGIRDEYPRHWALQQELDRAGL